MGRKPYRVEVTYPSKGKPQYFLVKDIKVRGNKRKIRKYLGVIPLSTADKNAFRKKYAYEMEMRAAIKKAELSAAFYNSQCLSKSQVIDIETIRSIYNTFTELLTTSEIEVYERNFDVKYIQGTTSIEGNTLTLQQTQDLLIDGLMPKNKSLREINEVQNFKKVKTYRDKYRGKVSIDFIRTLHSLIMSNIDIQSAGTFRRTDEVWIQGCDLRLSPKELIENDLKKAIDTYYEGLEKGMHPFEVAVLFHHEFELIHPFTDGNGRVGREIFNYMLKKGGYPKLLFLGSDRDKYIESLRLGNEDKHSEMIQIFFDLIYKQRYHILIENLKNVVVAPQKSPQRLILDFVL
jgi:fido (protein-threonine AMPylation protein)